MFHFRLTCQTQPGWLLVDSCGVMCRIKVLHHQHNLVTLLILSAAKNKTSYLYKMIQKVSHLFFLFYNFKD